MSNETESAQLRAGQIQAGQMPSPGDPPKKSKLGCILLGIGGGLLAIVLLCAGIIGAGVFGVFAIIKNSQPYEESLRRAQTSVEVQRLLGEPIEAGTMVQGNFDLSNDEGEADISYSISGPDGSGTVHVAGKKSGGPWEYDRMDVKMDQTGEVVDLME